MLGKGTLTSGIRTSEHIILTMQVMRADWNQPPFHCPGAQQHPSYR